MEEEEEMDQHSRRASRLFMPGHLFTPPSRFEFSADHRGTLLLTVSLRYLNCPIRTARYVWWKSSFSFWSIILKPPRKASSLMDTRAAILHTHRALSHGGLASLRVISQHHYYIAMATSGANRTSGSSLCRSYRLHHIGTLALGVAETPSAWLLLLLLFIPSAEKSVRLFWSCHRAFARQPLAYIWHYSQHVPGYETLIRIPIPIPMHVSTGKVIHRDH